MPTEAEDKEKVLEYLRSVGGKGVATIPEIAKGTELPKRDLMKLIKELELEGKITAGGRAAGVGGYKLA